MCRNGTGRKSKTAGLWTLKDNDAISREGAVSYPLRCSLPGKKKNKIVYKYITRFLFGLQLKTSLLYIFQHCLTSIKSCLSRCFDQIINICASANVSACVEVILSS